MGKNENRNKFVWKYKMNLNSQTEGAKSAEVEEKDKN